MVRFQLRPAEIGGRFRWRFGRLARTEEGAVGGMAVAIVCPGRHGGGGVPAGTALAKPVSGFGRRSFSSGRISVNPLCKSLKMEVF